MTSGISSSPSTAAAAWLGCTWTSAFLPLVAPTPCGYTASMYCNAQLAASKPLCVPLWLVGGQSFHRQPADSDLGQSPTAEFHAANREGKAHTHFLKPVDQAEIDLLLDIHVPVVVGGLHDVDHLVGHPALIEGQEMGAVKFHLVQSVDDALHQLTNLTRLIARRVVGNAEFEDDAAGGHA